MTPDAFSNAQAALLREAKAYDTGVYEDWLLLHQPLVAVAQKFGAVSDSGDGDFYHSGDWFTSLTDGFVLLTAAPISKMRLADFQRVLAARSPAAVMTLAGDICTEVEGLEMLVHPKAVLASWSNCDRSACVRRFRDVHLQDA